MIEIIIVLALMAIVATLPMLNHQKLMEKQYSLEALSNLQFIFDAEQRYKLLRLNTTDTYFVCDNDPCEKEQLAKLGVSAYSNNFSYSVTSGNVATEFLATATRKGTGICAGKVMKITQKGDIDKTECSSW